MFGSRTTMKCHGCLFDALPVSRPASSTRRITSSGTGRSWYSRTASRVWIASETSMSYRSFPRRSRYRRAVATERPQIRNSSVVGPHLMESITHDTHDRVDDLAPCLLWHVTDDYVATRNDVGEPA